MISARFFPSVLLALGLVAVAAPGCKKDKQLGDAVGSCMSGDSCLSRSTTTVSPAVLRQDCTGRKKWIDGPCPKDNSIGGCRDVGDDPQELWFYAPGKKGLATADDVRAFCGRRKQLYLPVE